MHIEQEALPICFHGQKIVNVDSKVISIEMLSRINHEMWQNNIESFIESLSIRDKLSLTLEQITNAAKVYQQLKIPVSINVDNTILTSPDCKNALLNHTQHITYPVTLEFTETYPMPPADDVNSFFFDLKKNTHIKIGLDDFGTGFNGMCVFADYDFDLVKIDRQMIMGIEKRPQKLRILEHIASLLRVLKKQHVIEGIENKEQYEALKGVGFTTFQGFFFHKPEPIDNLDVSLSNDTK
ncbi:hypothetical protein LCGC14_0952260 [marine sediment metagenome]|uniref:EAL domain-containing protein n=1 Tax=marine sediment metagenome TaxID=412755 RepID=A0A0F9NH24_9ZZZZ